VLPSQTNWLAQIGTDLNHPGKSLVLRCLAVMTLISISGCTGGKSLQNNLAPDPKLQDPATVSPKPSDAPTKSTNSLPTDFPLYTQAQLQSTAETKEGGTVTTWTTPDSIEFVYKFYQQELPSKQWEIITPPSDSSPQLVAKQQQTTVTIAPQTSTEKQQAGLTTYTISLLSTTTPPTPVPTPAASTQNPSAAPISTKPSSSAPTATADYLTDLTKIGVLTSKDTATNRVVTRREYARWLVAAHNKITGTKPTQQIKLAATDTKPIFQDVPSTNPDFPSIQGLAEAGLIPSPLSGDATSVLFRPDTPLTREQMILWKIPLDTRQSLPAASLDAVKQTWGFQDAGKVDPKALRAVLADFQNGEQSNIRRVFGYTTLFQPKKTVSLGEVAIAIWYFGANSEGLSARDAVGGVGAATQNESR
jgi:S-layer homology domain